MLKKLYLPWIALTLAIGSAPLLLGQESSPSPSPTEPEAMPILKKMAEFLGKATNFSVTILEGFDVVQESGQKIEFGATRKMLVNRPNNLRVEVEKSGGEKNLILFDGKEITVYNQTANFYATAAKVGTLDDAIQYAVVDLGLRVPLALLFISTLPDELEARVAYADYVEPAVIDGTTCDHIAARTLKGVDIQFWIAQGAEPLPKRIVITYTDEKGEPQFRADLTDWNLAPEVAASSFSFTPPAGVERVPFLAQVENIAPKGVSKKGAKK